VVTATDVRPAAKEQVESLGAKFIAVEDEEFKQAETAAGYAKEMSKEYQHKQAALVAEHIKKQDVVITTALIPGRPAPRLIAKEMVASMRPGSVIVDCAVDQGGCVETIRETTHADPVYERDGVLHYGVGNIPAAVPHTSTYALTNATLPFALALARFGVAAAVAAEPALAGGINTLDGRVTNPVVAGALGRPHTALDEVLEPA
jgi:NAD(P) transhydrogenase subunit alpha